ncbi:MAG TPA: NAD(P)/FAD-dependent oxidoreductase [Nocardioides sp.]|uniref:flavin monoamine oxidase family protein n=1 Tax=uncultured Nocardioides sp. TaxID=198441 RepID=UPI0026378E49|nr:NAD(P)/FAD-dependent oxidoreductase [uncultured Nocardioides sp.]HRD63109.1 NAD(P)/FAD-dependent oxidoreductase [Nocardioides sp.]HRI95958.1 NAD(P)/FAD-dependent oxidoreductase [Nocardioides sp.]
MPARAFDDGSTEIPTPVPGEPGRVVVVGAGIAGLTVANALTAAGVDCVVVEARDRIGGRLHTVEVDGHVADLGGAWIHHPEGNVLSDWVEHAAVPWIVDPTGTRFTGADLGEGRRLGPEELAGVGYAVFEPVARRVRADLAAGRPDRSVAEVVDEYLAEAGPPGAERDRLRQLMAAMVEQDGAGPFDAISARWALTEDMFVGDVVDHVPVGGYRSILSPLAAGLAIRLGLAVRRIEQTGDGVRVVGDGWSESGTHAVVTAPLGVLKSGAVEFVPPLPPQRQAIIDRTGFGTLEKVVLAFDEPFWRDRDPGLQHSVIYPADRREPAIWTWDFGLSPTLMFLVAHGAASSMRRDPLAWAVEQLEAVYGEPLPIAPTAFASTDWLGDRYARGAYAHVCFGERASDLDALGEPVDRICFAGEYTGSERAGYADGAMSSGLREAKRLLQQAAVRLVAPVG